MMKHIKNTKEFKASKIQESTDPIKDDYKYFKKLKDIMIDNKIPLDIVSTWPKELTKEPDQIEIGFLLFDMNGFKADEHNLNLNVTHYSNINDLLKDHPKAIELEKGPIELSNDSVVYTNLYKWSGFKLQCDNNKEKDEKWILNPSASTNYADSKHIKNSEINCLYVVNDDQSLLILNFQEIDRTIYNRLKHNKIVPIKDERIKIKMKYDSTIFRSQKFD